MTIYEIESAILSCVDPDTGEIIDTERLESLNMAFESKIDNIACWVKQLIADALAIKAEKDKLADRQKVKENQAERLKVYLSGVLKGMKFETARNKISWRKSDTINVLNIADIPAEFKHTVTEVNADKNAIKAAIKGGKIIPGAELIQNSNIQIK